MPSMILARAAAVLTVFVLGASAAGCGSDESDAADAADAGTTGGTSGAGAAPATGGAAGSGGSSGSASGGTAGGLGGSGGAGASGGAAGSGGSGGVACGDLTTFADGATVERELHVSAAGDDQNDGSAGSPLRTLPEAARRAQPGTAIRLHAGTYPGGAFVADLSGRADAPIWIGGMPGESRPVLEGGAEAIHFTRPRYVVIHDLEVRGTTSNGLNIDDGGDYANADAAAYVVVRNVNVQDVGGTGNQDCLKMSGVNHFWVLGSSFARCGGAGSGSGIDMVGCHQGTIAGSRFDEMSGNAVQAKGGSEDVDILANLFTNAGLRALNMGGSTGFEFFRPPLDAAVPAHEARRIRAAANVIVGSQAAVAFVGCVDCAAHNNTIVDPTRWVLRILQETTSASGYTFLPASNGAFFNNVVFFARSQLAAFSNVGVNTDAASFRFSNNLWYAHDDPTRSQPTDLPAAEQNGIQGQDPAFTNPGSGDYTIGASSPAAGAGTALQDPLSDFSGRCFASPPSIGAFEVTP